VRRGSYAAVEAERCVGCGKCAKLCPVGCIEVKARGEA
jgi:Fe-S-cluster-containing hydrogenase component 2